jgi:hypothetical protein
LALSLLVTGTVGATGGCGPLLFVPSPYTPQKVERVYSVQEDITLVRWRISSNDPADPNLRFEILDDDGNYQPIDFSQSVYPGGGAPCADKQGSCFQYVLRGDHTADQARPIVRAIHAEQGTFPGEPATARTVPASLSVASYFHTGNDLVYVSLADTVAYDSPYVFPRAYERTMWPTRGLCVSDSPPDGVGFSPLDATGGFPPTQPLTDDGTYCVGLRPVPGDAGGAALAQARVATLPQVVEVPISYTPPIQQSPVIYQIVFDLEIPVADRCNSALQKIEGLVDQAMTQGGLLPLEGVQVLKLPTVNLALDPNAPGGGSACAQPQSGGLDADAMAEAVKQAVTGFPQQFQQFHLLFFDNLNAPLPPDLSDSLQTLFTDLAYSPPGHNLETLGWLFNPGFVQANNLPWWKSQTWTSADDPDLAMTLLSYGEQALPYTSELYAGTPVPLFSPDQVTAYAGGMFKVCSANTPFQVVDPVSGQPQYGGPGWPILSSAPPAVAPSLYPPMGAAASDFIAVSFAADVQVCTKYCAGHPFIATDGTGATSWSTTSACAVTK